MTEPLDSMPRVSRAGEAGPGGSRSRELLSVLLLLGAFVAVNLVTATRFPIVWGDEVVVTDPAVNLCLGRGFTSSAWNAATRDRFWAGNVPLHEGVLYLWLRVFGVSPLAVRSLNIALLAVSALSLWAAVRRAGFITLARNRLLFLLVAFSGYATGFAWHSGRHDDVSILLASLATLAFTFERSRTRLISLALLGALFPFAGLQLVAFAGIFCLTLVLASRLKYLKESCAIAAGMAAGAVGVYALYASHGVWSDFLGSLRMSRSMGGSGLPKDPSLYLLFAAGVMLAIGELRRGTFRPGSPLGFGLLVGVAVPGGMMAIGHFPTYYSWMAYIPLSAGVLSSPRALTLKGAHAVAATALILLACAVGLPLQVASAVNFWRVRDYGRVEAYVNSLIRADDWIYCEPAAYYPSTRRSRNVFLRTYFAMTPEEKARISILIVPPREAPTDMARLGGTWTRVGSPLTSGHAGFLGLSSRLGDKLTWNYELEAWRRKIGP